MSSFALGLQIAQSIGHIPRGSKYPMFKDSGPKYH